MASKDKYRVLRKLDSGGMAEVFVGEVESLEGFTKQVAIKRVLPHLAENKKFIAMFLDEARLSLRLSHANVVSVFDIGHSGESYFIVMEYVAGTNLKQVMEEMRDRGSLMPVELAVYIVMEICRALAYAHGQKDGKGKNLGIVHRDVSPPNVLLSREGEVKIVDFGLAKATSQLERTDPGVVKGKFAYLAPEAAWGKGVDHRADQFACGIILWELLTGKRLFLGESDVQTVKLVRRADVPSPRELNPKVPEALEQVLLKALSSEPADRYQGCNEMAEALADVLFSHSLRVTGFDVQRLVRSVAGEEEPEPSSVSPGIADLISEELSGFASIGEQEVRISQYPEPAGSLVDGEDDLGAQPLDYGGFGDIRDSSTNLDPPLAAAVDPDPRDSGTEAFGRTSSAPEGPVEGLPDASAPSLAQMLEGDLQEEVEPDEPPARGPGLALAIIGGGVVLVGGGLALLAVLLGWL